jgi:hypothetical protein
VAWKSLLTALNSDKDAFAHNTKKVFSNGQTLQIREPLLTPFISLTHVPSKLNPSITTTSATQRGWTLCPKSTTTIYLFLSSELVIIFQNSGDPPLLKWRREERLPSDTTRHQCESGRWSQVISHSLTSISLNVLISGVDLVR